MPAAGGVSRSCHKAPAYANYPRFSPNGKGVRLCGAAHGRVCDPGMRACLRRNRSSARSLDMTKKVQQVMTSPPKSVRRDTPIRSAAELMQSEDVGSLPVVENGG